MNFGTIFFNIYPFNCNNVMLKNNFSILKELFNK